MRHYADLPQAINDLRTKGYTLDFSPQTDCIVSEKESLRLSPEEFTIDDAFRFEGDSDPENQSILYAISSAHGAKGLLINSYGIYADPLSDAMIHKLTVMHK